MMSHYRTCRLCHEVVIAGLLMLIPVLLLALVVVFG